MRKSIFLTIIACVLTSQNAFADLYKFDFSGTVINNLGSPFGTPRGTRPTEQLSILDVGDSWQMSLVFDDTGQPSAPGWLNCDNSTPERCMSYGSVSGKLSIGPNISTSFSVEGKATLFDQIQLGPFTADTVFIGPLKQFDIDDRHRFLSFYLNSMSFPGFNGDQPNPVPPWPPTNSNVSYLNGTGFDQLLGLPPEFSAHGYDNTRTSLAIAIDGENHFFELGPAESFSITAVPIPASAWLFGSALISFFGVKQRKLITKEKLF